MDDTKGWLALEAADLWPTQLLHLWLREMDHSCCTAQVDDTERQFSIGAGPHSFFIFSAAIVLHLCRHRGHLAQVVDPEQRLPIGATGLRPAQVLYLRSDH